ncbi:carbohydrate ABC transporter permease [Cyanobium gracile]|uniref:ABC-type sugar transport system, permease component n=1 Tax=Cyanobium gracile (strain ATCC 27147 / PCC 6307) TaxID=292564 RepID=K9P528_CYAGP|nr:carbohydrate ABC transporter permease [Cyanobium gracile]AFY27806.1 ABC-type sugar transport system, permease component [Cyanobium gracile PCC 6307]
MRLLVLLWSLGPLLWQLRTSLLRPEALVAPLLEGNPWTLANYRLVLSGDPPFWRYLGNSTLVALATTLLTLLLAVPCAYGLQQQRGLLRWGVGLALAAAAMFPTVLLFLALLEIARSFGLANDLLALSLPYAGLSLPLAVLLLRAAFADLPIELEDAARLEGLGLGQRLRHVLLPLLGPALASTGILVFLASWNEYAIALTWISRNDLLTLPIAIARIGGGSVFTIPYGAFAAATVLGSLPLLLLVLLAQRPIVAGLTRGAVKG